ncbi:hypothetical protein [Natrinema sp. SYSU A 869]|uniref:hypothetical protein n=1 Tax=Natrinema sp. SYSU A 869 TaxID=2871694 RepID=UPI001CA3B6C0|nr:hypothetical protein [Natrinema sp. SYSU A 869]
MSNTNTDVPVHDSLQVLEATSLYRTDEWWKAVVTYQFDTNSDANETAVYLWHRDDDSWTRKNKYVVKTAEAWATDREIIDQYIRSDPPSDVTMAFPVSDYYTVGVGETLFQNDNWWKAIVNIVEKGSYETNEGMVYLWQKQDGEWRRRQKYAIKSVSDWEEERAVIDEQLSLDEGVNVTVEADDVDDGISGELATLDDELDAHLSEEFT